MFNLEETGLKTKKASEFLNGLSENKINSALLSVAESIERNVDFLKEQNQIDLDNALLKRLSESFIDRLTLSDKVISGIVEGIKQVVLLKSPVGKSVYSYNNEEQGIKIEKKQVPFGVIGIIYESRPNVTADAFALCFKTSNAVILRGGSDSINSNKAIVKVIKEGLKNAGVDENAINLIEDTSHETAEKFMKLDKYIDLLIPRGGQKLIKSAVENATVPVIQTGVGNCHIYVDSCANVDMAVKVIFNAKTQRYSVCNACESLVIHSDILEKVLPKIYEKLSEKQVEMRLDQRAYEILKGKDNCVLATKEDFYTEYCDAIISVKTVDSLKEAINHINEYSTHHSESIITDDLKNAEIFLNSIDSACVYHNASTRFSDGFVFGLGAEIGISTQKLHARGPMGLEALVTQKYLVSGNGSVRK